MTTNSASTPPAAHFLGRLIDATGSGAARPTGLDLARAVIVALLDSGEIEVVVPPDDGTRIRCDFLETSANATLRLERGDLVLLMPPAGVGQNGCVLGRIGRYRPPEEEAPPDRVVIEANEALTLKCGESSVEMRQDGKVLIRGQDVVARGERSTKIKGGTVAIN